MFDFDIFHNSQDTFYRNPFGATPCGSNIIIKIKAVGARKVTLLLRDFNYKEESIYMFKSEDSEHFQVEINLKDAGIINYYFIIESDDKKVFYGNNHGGFGGIGQIYYDNPKYFQITVYKDFSVPSWYREGIMYQIFVDSFFNGNENNQVLNKKKNSFIYGDWNDKPMYIKDKDGNILRWCFYGGNLKGIIKKLAYLKSLNVTILYLNPIFEASSVHKYDSGDYLKIDPMFGNDDIFEELTREAMKMGIRIVLDGVFSHTGDDSIYFNRYGNYQSIGAYQSEDSPYYSWYKFKNYPYEYDCWWGGKTLPNVDELNKSYGDFIIDGENSVISKWMRLGASGWRLDVADELPDEFIRRIKSRIKKENREGILLGEVWEDASNKISYNKRRKYLFGEELDSVMNYPFKDATLDFFMGKLTSKDIKNIFMSMKENYPKEVFNSNMNILGTHDTKRVLTVFEEHTCNREIAKKLFKLSVIFQMTFAGIPCIYYGDEAGILGGVDPYNRSSYPWGKEDLDILNLYKKITTIRNSREELKKGDINFYNTKEDILIFERVYNDEKIIVIFNKNIEYSKEENVFIEEDNLQDLLTGDKFYKNKDSYKFEMEPLSVKILKNIKNKGKI